MAHGEYKTAGGKLVIADFNLDGGRLSDVSISGDFFLEPEEALELINQSLTGVPATATEEEIATTIRRELPDGVAMIGFSPEAVAIAVRRGLQE